MLVDVGRCQRALPCRERSAPEEEADDLHNQQDNERLGKVLHDEDMAAAILDRVLERGRFIHLDGPSGRTRHLNLEEILPAGADRARISGINAPEFPEPTALKRQRENRFARFAN